MVVSFFLVNLFQKKENIPHKGWIVTGTWFLHTRFKLYSCFGTTLNITSGLLHRTNGYEKQKLSGLISGM